MQCDYCGKQAYVAHICPYCKQQYCSEHREPRAHDCSFYKRLYQLEPKPMVVKPQPHAAEGFQKSAINPAVVEGAQKKLFVASFTLVVLEEILRIFSYLKNPPIFAYLDGNIYVEFLYQSISPYIASVIVFVLVCSILFATKWAAKNRSSSNTTPSLLKQVIPLCIFAAVLITYLFSIVNWLFILAS